MIFLASPYTHPDPFVREERYLRALHALHHLTVKGEVVFSPIVHSHKMAQIGNMPSTAADWESINAVFLSFAKKLLVLRIDGWEKSLGVKEEIRQAEALGIPVEYL